MWFQIQGRIGRWNFEYYWHGPHLVHKLKYRFSAKYRASLDEIPF